MTTRRFYTSDLHVDHTNIIKLNKRPFINIDEMKETIITNWNKTVTNSDIVYLLGDTCLKVQNFIELVKVLNGQLHIIRGNHDDEVIKKAINGYKIKNVVYHRDILRVKDGSHTVILSHYPIYEWDRWFRGSIHLYGHVHGNIGRSFRPRAYDVGVNIWNYRPVTLDEIIKSKDSLTCFDCMHKDVCKYREQGIDRKNCTCL